MFENKYQSNSQIFVEDLPIIQDIIFEPLQKNYLKINLASTIITLLILFGILTSLSFIFEFPHYVNYGIWIFLSLITISSIGFIILSFPHLGFAVRELDTVFKKGLIFRSIVVIPSNRIQHIEINQGFLERFYNLASIEIFTAGGRSSDLTIPGLTLDQAKSLKSYLINKSSLDEEE